MNLNKVLIGGTITRDPETRFLGNGTAVLDLGMVMNRNWTDNNGQKNEEACFVDVTFFGRSAEVISEHFRKGGQILVEGRLKLDEWEDRNSGQKRSKLKVMGERFEFCNKNEGGGGGYREERQERPQQQRQPAPPADDYGEDEDDIPF